MATIQYVPCCLLSLGKDTVSLNPKLSTSPIARKTNLVGQTKLIVRRELQRYQLVHKIFQKTLKIIFIDNLIINVQFTGSRQTRRKRILHLIELQEHRGEHCIEDQRERISHLGTSYGPIGLR